MEEEYYEPQKKYGLFDIRRHTKKPGGIFTYIGTRIPTFIALFLIVLVTFTVYIYGTSDAGARTMDSSKEYALKAIDYIPSIFRRAENVGQNAWGAESTVGILGKSGITFDGFSSLAEEVPQGARLTLSYKLGIENADLDGTRVDVRCRIKGTEIEGQIVPPDVTLEGRRVTKNIRCVFSPEQTAQLEGTQTVSGEVSYAYETKDATLPVYFTSFDIFNMELDMDEDFFDHYGIPESNPIRAKYNGEPVEIGIGVSTEDVQPVVLEQGIEPLVGITLSNKWDGEMTELKDLRLEVPYEFTRISDLSDAPSIACPFVESRESSSLREYRIASELKEEIKLKTGSRQTFECFFDVDESILDPGQPYTKRFYRASAEYVYKLPERTESVTIRRSGQTEIAGEGELAITEVEPEV
ncbi:MAG: hypothetical protein ABIB71_00290 [Candidatus Woesearchaeota archaeon]